MEYQLTPGDKLGLRMQCLEIAARAGHTGKSLVEEAEALFKFVTEGQQ